MAKKKDDIAEWPIAKLKRNLKQDDLFGDVDDAELQALADDMEKHGQRVPVEILPNGTIIAGHQRVRAAKLLGWRTIRVRVRHDLAKNAAAAERLFVGDNFFRRQLSPLGRARCIQRLMEIEFKSRPAAQRWGKKEALKKSLGTRLHLSARSVDRYLLVLDTDLLIQAAFDAGDISLIQAGKVARLHKEKQQEIVRRLRAGEKAKAVVAEALTQRGTSSGDPLHSFERLIGALKRETPLLRGRQKELKSSRLRDTLPLLQKAKDLVTQLLAQATKSAS